jgi:hypothetical protein
VEVNVRFRYISIKGEWERSKAEAALLNRSVFVIGGVFGSMFEFGDVFGSVRFQSSLQSDVKKQLFCNLVLLMNCNSF